VALDYGRHHRRHSFGDEFGLLPESSVVMRFCPRVLIVEDEAAISEILSEALHEDYEVVCVARVDEALLVFGQQRIDVVLLDYHLLDGNAQDVAKRADQAEVPVVWIPGDPDIVETLVRASHFLLAKPFGIQQVLDMLAKARGLH
jgi:DNA-binding response OmpR family regulator